MRKSLSIPMAALMFVSQITASLGDATECAADIIALMQKDKHAMGHKTIEMLKAYNKTCIDKNYCVYNMDEDTESYLNEVTEDDGTPNLPEVPIVGSAVADFEGFAQNEESYDAYMDLCLEEGGYVKFVDTDVRIKGTAMDLVDVDVTVNLKAFPMCLVKGCKDQDLEEILEEAVKHAVIANADDLSDQQKAVINGMNIALACAASGIETCELSIYDSDALPTISAATAVGPVVTVLATAVGVIYTTMMM